MIIVIQNFVLTDCVFIVTYCIDSNRKTHIKISLNFLNMSLETYFAESFIKDSHSKQRRIAFLKINVGR